MENGIIDNKDVKCHYVYKLTDTATGRFYVGHHFGLTTDAYKGSGIWCIEMHKNGHPLTKEIIAIFPSKAKAMAFERLTISTIKNKKLCQNLALRNSLPVPLPPKPNDELFWGNIRFARGNLYAALKRGQGFEETIKKILVQLDSITSRGTRS